jgi:signal transduction histidine kinase
MTTKLVAGVLLSLLVITSYAAYTIHSVKRMRTVQSDIVERNRKASLQLIRIQSDLNALALAMRDMLDSDASSGYPLSAWTAQFSRIRENLNDAVGKEAELSHGRRNTNQTAFLASSMDQFWKNADLMFADAEAKNDSRAKDTIRQKLQPAQESLTALTARLLVDNNEEEQRAAEEIGAIYTGIERNAYWFLLAAVLLVTTAGWLLIQQNRRTFERVADLSTQRSELARQLITMQETTLRAISRDLHDEFGQILTALGAMLRRAERQAPDSTFKASVQETATIVQNTLENVRSLSQSLQPVMLEEQGLTAAIPWYLGVFERQNGIIVHYTPPETPVDVEHTARIQIFRVLQESLNNIARHANVQEAFVRLQFDPANGELSLEMEDHGPGLPEKRRPGVGLTAMSERAALLGGTLSIISGTGGTTIRLHVPGGKKQ